MARAANCMRVPSQGHLQTEAVWTSSCPRELRPPPLVTGKGDVSCFAGSRAKVHLGELHFTLAHVSCWTAWPAASLGGRQGEARLLILAQPLCAFPLFMGSAGSRGTQRPSPTPSPLGKWPGRHRPPPVGGLQRGLLSGTSMGTATPGPCL